MICGIGTDIVKVERMRAGLERFGERFVRRILAESEREDFAGQPHPARFLAKRFAAKEAAVKALGTGFRRGLGPRDVAVGHDAAGKPSIVWSPKAAKVAAGLGVGAAHLSLADEAEYAVAFVVLLAVRP